MFNGIEIILGIICSILGIALGYVTILAIIVGVKLAIKHTVTKSEKFVQNLDTERIFH